ncbi:hypothetical protein EDB84DRAFT_1561294 [Lactarius hengduanensis]|nr:hypothetical protein EDB84DRAFT_1561294 [Lactarius hengduanensis]
MATITSRPSTTSARIRSKTSELSDLFRGRQHSSIPPPSIDPSNKSKRKIPLFSLRKKSPVAPPGHRSPTHTPLPTPRPSTNVTPSGPNPTRSQLPQLTIPSTSFHPLPTFEDASSSKRSSISPTNSRSTRSTPRPPSSLSSNGLNKSRTPTPTSAIALGGSFSDSEPPRSASVRTPTVLLRSYASDDEDRKFLTTRILPPAKPPPTTPLPPPPEDDAYSTELVTPTSPGSPKIFFPGQAGPYEAKLLSSPNGRRLAISTPRSPSHKFTSGSESASESAQGYTSASGSESAATGLGLGFRIRTRSGVGSGNDSSSTSRAASVRVGLLRTPTSLTGSRSLSPPSPKSPVISLSKSSPALLPASERTTSPRPSHSSAKRVSPPVQSATLKPPELPGGKQQEPGTKHASWLVVPKAAHASPVNPPGQASVQDSKVTVPSKLRARAASDSRMLTSTGPASSIGANLPASSAVGASSQSITAPRSSSAPTPTSPSNFSKSPSTAAASSTLTNRVGSGSTSPPPAEPLPGLPRSSLSRASSESSRQAGGRSTSSPSSSESSTRTLIVPTSPSSTSNALSASGADTSTNIVSSTSGSTAPSAFRSSPAIVSTASVRRPRDERPANKEKSKDSTWPFRSGSKRSSPPFPSPLVQSHISSESPPYAPPSSFSASTIATQPSSSPQPPPSRVVVPIPPTPANIFALQTENADLRAEIASLRGQLDNVERVVRRREREIRGLRWLVVNWSGEKKEEFGFTAFTERRPSAETTESQEEVQAAVRYLRAESESGYGSGSVSGSQSRLSHSSAYSSVYPAESISDGSGSEVGTAQRFGPGPSARASEDQALDAIPERTAIGGEDSAEGEAERRWKEERRASRALKRLSASTAADLSGGGLDKVVAQALQTNNTVPHGPAMSIEQVIEGDRARRERVGLKGMDEVLDKLRAAAGAKRP